MEELSIFSQCLNAKKLLLTFEVCINQFYYIYVSDLDFRGVIIIESG